MAIGSYKSFTFLLRQTDKAPAPSRHVVSMKTTALAIGLVTGLAADLFAGGTLRLKIEPDRDVLLAVRRMKWWLRSTSRQLAKGNIN